MACRGLKPPDWRHDADLPRRHPGPDQGQHWHQRPAGDSGLAGAGPGPPRRTPSTSGMLRQVGAVILGKTNLSDAFGNLTGQTFYMPATTVHP